MKIMGSLGAVFAGAGALLAIASMFMGDPVMDKLDGIERQIQSL